MSGEAGALTRLPAEAVASLRRAFAGELVERLPHLRALHEGSAPDRDDIRRAVHSLASSAAVVDEPAASRAARALEEALVDGTPLEELRVAAGDLVALLEKWQP